MTQNLHTTRIISHPMLLKPEICECCWTYPYLFNVNGNKSVRETSPSRENSKIESSRGGAPRGFNTLMCS
jgi:hypothetical protein